MAERALPDLTSRLLIDTSPLNVAASAVASALGGMVSKAKDAGGEVEKNFNSTSQQMNLFGDNAEKNGKRATDSLRGVGAGLLGVGAVITATAAAVGGEALKMASDFQASAQSLAGSAQIPIESAQAIAQSFLTSGEKTIFSAQEMVKALDPVSGQLELLTGHALTTAEAHQVMSAAADLATATHTNLADTTRVLSSVMLAYHIPLSQAAEASSVLFETSRLVNVPLDDLQAILARLHARLGPIAPSLNDTSTLMVDLAENGITGSRAINQVNTAMTTLLGSSPEVSAELQKLGIHVFDSSGHFVGLRSVIEQTQHAQKGMTDQQKLASDAIIFGGGSAKAMFQVMDGGVGTWDKAAAAVGTAGAAHKAAGDVMGGVTAQQKILDAQMKNLGVVIGQDLLPFLTTLLGAITPVITAIVHWAAEHPKLATGILLGAAAFGVLLVVVGGFLIILPGLIAGIGAVTAVSLPWLIIIIAIIAAVGLLVAGGILLITHWNQVVAVAQAVWHWITQLVVSHKELFTAILILFGPLGILTAAIILVATHWQQIWSIMQAFAGWIVGFFTGIWSGLVGAVTGAWSAIYGAVAGFLGAIYGAIASTFGAIYGAVAGAIGAVYGFITAAFGAIWLFLSTWGLVIVAIIATPFILAFQAIAPIIVGIYNMVAGGLSALASFIGGILSGIYNFFYGIFTGIWNFLAGAFAGIYNTVAGWLSAIWNFTIGVLTGIYNFYYGIFTGIWNFLAGVFAGIWNTIWTWLTAVWTGIIQPILTGIWNFHVATWTNIWNFVTAIWTGMWNTINFWATTIWNGIVAIFTAIWNFISPFWTNIWIFTGQIWNGIWNTINYWAGAVRDTVGNIFNSLGGIVHNALSALATQVGTDVNWIIHRVNDFLDKVWATFHGFGIDLPIHDIPHLEGYPYAEGGIVEQPTHAIVGEAGHPETIIPWDPAKRDRALDLWQTTGLALGAVPLSGAREGKGAGPDLNNVPTSGHGGQCLAFLSQYFPQLRGIPAAKDAASLINSNTAKPGEVAINTSIAPYGHAALVINPPNMVLDSNWDEHENIMIHPLSDVKAAGFIDFGATLGTLAGGAAGGIFDVANAINQIIDQILSSAGAGPKWLEGTLPAILKNMAGPQIIEWIKKNFAAQIAKLTSSVAGAFSAIKGAFAGGVDQWITQGEQLAGVGDDWHAALKARIGVESGGDPNIDQSGLTGYAQAHGIMQMINSTFAAYALPGHTNIYNPVDNIAAAIKYIEKRYGGWQGMPPLSQGYDQGGVFPSGTIGYNTSGEDEYVFTKGQLRGLGGGPADDRVLEVLQRIEQKVMGHLEVNTYGTNLTPRDVAREIVQEVRAI